MVSPNSSTFKYVPLIKKYTRVIIVIIIHVVGVAVQVVVTWKTCL